MCSHLLRRYYEMSAAAVSDWLAVYHNGATDVHCYIYMRLLVTLSVVTSSYGCFCVAIMDCMLCEEFSMQNVHKAQNAPLSSLKSRIKYILVDQ